MNDKLYYKKLCPITGQLRNNLKVCMLVTMEKKRSRDYVCSKIRGKNNSEIEIILYLEIGN